MKISNITENLNKVVKDKNVGVKLTRLTGDETTTVFAIELENGQSIPAHYHKEGIETYFILNGKGLVKIGSMKNDIVEWETQKAVGTGDCFTIYPKEVHEFRNLEEETLRIIATAPLNHSENDRYFVEKSKSPNR